MKILHRFLLILCLSFIPFLVLAEAPVIDESENYAFLDDQQAAFEQPVDERPFAKDDVQSDKNNNLMLVNKLQGLQQELQELRGQLEVQAHQLKSLQEQQLNFYKDLDSRVPNKTAKLNNNEYNWAEPKPKPIPQTPVKKDPGVIHPIEAKATRQNPAEEQISYLAAYELIKNKQYDQALVAMNQFVTQYPQGGYTSNAHYWLGELHLVKKNYNEALIHFKTVLDQFPSSSKTAASMLKVGYAFAALGKKQEAVNQLQLVMKNFPDTNTAQLAKAKLETLSS